MAVLALAIAAALALSLVCDTTPDTGYGDFSLGAAALLGVVVWPIGFATIVPLPPPIGAVLLLSYWPLFGFLGYQFLVRQKWGYAVPCVLLVVLPAVRAAMVFEAMMGI
ncbi:MAG: hypothetical protein QM765_31155 [Myxococcales bacterium]